MDNNNTTTRAHGIPNQEEVQSYASSLPMAIKPETAVAFFDTMEAGGWITKQGHPIADWRAAFRRYASVWAGNENSPKKGNYGAANGNQPKTTIQDLMGGRKLNITRVDPNEKHEPEPQNDDPCPF